VRRRVPVATLIVLSITAIVTGLQFPFPVILATLERRPGALSAGEWWRVITPLFVHADGWTQIAFNFVAIALIGTLVEWIYGPRWWLLFYFVSGVVGEIIALGWQPRGAGASLAGCGVLGALMLWLVLTRHRLPLRSRIGGVAVLGGGVVLSALREIHGPPILMGVCLAMIAQIFRSGLFVKSHSPGISNDCRTQP